MCPRRILIVDDELELAELVEAYLRRDGFLVSKAYTGKQALEVAASDSPDLILLDIMLPEENGMEVCKKIREASNVPILFLTAKKDEVDKITGLGLGADDYITKPFSPGELMARVKAHLRRAYQDGASVASASIVRAANLEIDLDRYEVKVEGNTVALTAKEFELLKFLAQHPNQVFTHESLYNAVWGSQSLGDIRTVMVHIRRLRKKVELDPTEPSVIKTVWGVGYKLEA